MCIYIFKILPCLATETAAHVHPPAMAYSPRMPNGRSRAVFKPLELAFKVLEFEFEMTRLEVEVEGRRRRKSPTAAVPAINAEIAEIAENRRRSVAESARSRNGDRQSNSRHMIAVHSDLGRWFEKWGEGRRRRRDRRREDRESIAKPFFCSIALLPGRYCWMVMRRPVVVRKRREEAWMKGEGGRRGRRRGRRRGSGQWRRWSRARGAACVKTRGGGQRDKAAGGGGEGGAINGHVRVGSLWLMYDRAWGFTRASSI